MKVKMGITVVLVVIAIILGIGIGSVFVPPADVVSIILHKLFGVALSESVTAPEVSIVWNIRTVRTLMAFVVGAALSASGSAMQSVLQNPLASSYTLGVSAGASVAASICIIGGFSFFGILTLPLLGMTFGILTVFAVVAVSTKLDRQISNITIVLVGMVISLFLSAVMSILIAVFKNQAERIILWQMGSFAGNQPIELVIVTVISVIGIFVLCIKSRELDILSFGEEQAFSMGIDVKKAKWGILIFAAGLTGCAISFVGIIGFIDLIAPHVTRRIFGVSHRIVIPMSAMFGGLFMVGCDICSRVIANPIELPVGAVTALIGAPFFMYIFFKKDSKEGRVDA
ncbi:FecCD family ABC transporter permease [Candidatus Epulonipiscium viviparus]|uniref:FecCD family ABC transporter permease n=1 Tax=Candidatus Epulonipiscium viviparus TaxID=420336 RepID=UPI0005C48676|nr:iron ABC transporter permease [Candidatus Epulopiscium viviparus]